jgi:hypothetical protein
MFHSNFKQEPINKDYIEYYHLATDSYMDDIIFANGIETETWDKHFDNKGWNCDEVNHICKRM